MDTGSTSVQLRLGQGNLIEIGTVEVDVTESSADGMAALGDLFMAAAMTVWRMAEEAR